MNNHIIFFSGGKSSFTVADYVKNKYPEDNIVLYFTDTLWEDEDLYRFIYEASDKLELPLLYHCAGINPLELMVKQKFMFNSRVGNCSKYLKMDVASNFLKKGIAPPIEYWHNESYLKSDDIKENATLYFGIGFDESHRSKAIKHNWQPFTVEFPLIDNVLDNDEVLKRYDIEQPKLYKMGFVHNNCMGRCVKAGKGHFRNLLETNKPLFEELMEQEILLSWYIRYAKQTTLETDHILDEIMDYIQTGKKTNKIKHILNINKYTKTWSFGNKRDGSYITEPYTFIKNTSLEDIYRAPQTCNLFDIGGCGCFVEY